MSLECHSSPDFSLVPGRETRAQEMTNISGQAKIDRSRIRFDKLLFQNIAKREGRF